MKRYRQARLRGAEQFGAVFARPTASRDAFFRVLSRPNGLAHNRLGMAVSRRVCGLAVGRNRLKRIIRESFWQNPGGRTEGAARDYVVLPTPAAASISNARLFASLQTHWRKQENLARKPADPPGGTSEKRGK